MKDNSRKINWIKAIVINLVIMVTVLLLTRMVYETNDDYAISCRIADGYPEVYFINYYLCVLFIRIQTFMSTLNAFIVGQIALSFISFVFVLKMILDRGSRTLAILTVAVIALFSLDHYCMVQFSKTAALVTVAGSMMIVDALTREKNLVYYVVGILLMLIGACLRIEGVVVPIGFAAVYIVMWMVGNRVNPGEAQRISRKALCLVLILVVGGSGLLFFASHHANSSTPELKEYVEYNDLRTRVIDFADLDNYDEQKAEYEKAGLSSNDIGMIKDWVFDYDGAASKENLQKILDIGAADKGGMTPKKAVKEFVKSTRDDIRNIDPTGVHIIILILLGLWLLISGKANWKIFVILAAGATVAMHIALFYMERPAYRAMYVPDLCAAMYLLYAASGADVAGKAKKASALVIAIISLLMIVPAYQQADDAYQSSSKRIMSTEMAEYMDMDTSAFYVTGTREKKSNDSYLTPLKAPDTKAEKNYMGTGSWGTKSPYLFEKMAPYGLKNPIKDLIDNDRAFYMGNRKIDGLTEYYNKWYGGPGKEIYLEQVDEVSGIKVWSVKTR